MKLLVPYVEVLRDEDRRLIRLAEFLGIDSISVALPRGLAPAGLLPYSASDQDSFLVVNPSVMAAWFGSGPFTHALAAGLRAQFRRILVHGLRADAVSSHVISALSQDRFTAVRQIDRKAQYSVAPGSPEITEAFSGLSFGPADHANDHVLDGGGRSVDVQPLISIGPQPFMAAIQSGSSHLVFIASRDVADIDAEVGDAPLTDHFSRLVPYAMALRHAAGDQCWRPNKPHACISIDDPLLQSEYGFLNFNSLLRMAERSNFHASIAFIPHNYKRSSPDIAQLFRQNQERLSICFHGNDHTSAEFASTDESFLNTLVDVAEDRMLAHSRATGVPCDRVMVFPQGSFSTSAMKVLKSHNFYAVVNTTRAPAEQPCRLSIAEQAQPAVLRHQGFPVLIRKPIRQIGIQDIAFALFFGRPVLVVEHHDIFEHPEALAQIASTINAVEPSTQWSNLETVAKGSFLTRRVQDANYRVRAFVGALDLENDSDHARHYSIEWAGAQGAAPVHQLLIDGQACNDYEVTDAGVYLNITLAPRSTHTISLVHRAVGSENMSLGVRWHAKAFVRRRLSEFRDNYLSKNRSLLTTAQALQRRFLAL